VNSPLEALQGSTGGLGYCLVAERSQVLYIRVPKAACTTILWGLLELEGYDPSMMERTRNPLLDTPDLVVHDMPLYPLPTIAEVSPAVRQAALTSPEWMRFAVVRNPYARLYSAWESKVLTRPPANRRFEKGPDFVEEGEGIDIGASYRRFVESIFEKPQPWFSDQHFQRQVELVPTKVIDDLELVPTADIAALFVRLSDRAGARVTPRNSNSGLGVAWTKVMDDKSAAKIFELYEQDFALTGTEAGAFSVGPPVILDGPALRLLQLAAERSDRTVQLNRAYQYALSNDHPVRRRAGKVVRYLRRRTTRP
jgi:Sulfotransferase family